MAAITGFKFDDPSTPYTPGAGAVGTASAPPVAPPPPTSPAPQIQTFAGYTPDYGGLIKSDPAYVSAESAATAAQASAAAQRRAALRTAVIRYGGALPANFTDQFGDIDKATLDQATGNQQSVIANLAQNYTQSEQQFLRQLAARGALQSGDLNYGEDQFQRGYAQQRYDAANQLGDTLGSAINSYTGVLNQNARDLASGVASAEANVSANPAYKPQPASYADYAAAESAQFGTPLYKDASGALYTADGNVYAPGGGGGGAAGAPAPDAAAATPAYDPNAYYQFNAGTGTLKTNEGRPTGGGMWMQ